MVDQEPGLDGFPQPDLVGQDGTTRKRGAEGEERRLDLVRVEVDLGIRQHRRQLLDAVGSATPRQFMGEVLGVVRRQVHRVGATGRSARATFVRHQDSPTSAVERRATPGNSDQPTGRIG